MGTSDRKEPTGQTQSILFGLQMPWDSSVRPGGGGSGVGHTRLLMVKVVLINKPLNHYVNDLQKTHKL